MLAAVLCFPAAAETVLLLPHGDLSAWEYRKFDGIAETRYESRFDESLGAAAVFAVGGESASGYTRKMEINAQKTPWLHFQWRIDAAAAGFDERTKGGDDFALRLYFAARDGLKYRSLSLVRANARRGESWESPHATWFNDLRIYAVIGGDSAAGEWQTSAVNIAALWEKLFGAPPPVLRLVGLMTDGDSAGVQMRARYGAIVLSDSEQSPFADSEN